MPRLIIWLLITALVPATQISRFFAADTEWDKTVLARLQHELADERRFHRADSSTQWLQHCCDRQVASHTRRATGAGRPFRSLAECAGLRLFLGISRRRN